MSAKVPHTLQVTSFGGVGTTMLLQFLRENGVDVQEKPSIWTHAKVLKKYTTWYSASIFRPWVAHPYWDPWKHLAVPPHDCDVEQSFRAVYLFDDPRNAVLSIFRRGYQNWHIRNMNGNLDEWKEKYTIDNFLSNRIDSFCMGEQFEAWVHAKRSYPILFIKFDEVWDHLKTLFSFVGLAQSKVDCFPEKRSRISDWRTEHSSRQEAIEEMYGTLACKVNDLESPFVKQAQ